jgi:2-dehydro-3-deoxygalactonokinase
MASQFIALDWGTSSFRAYLVTDGQIVDERAGSDGILTVKDGQFEAVFERYVEGWDLALPILASGMITSRQGWIEVPYRACPAGLSELAEAMVYHTTALGRKIAFIPGLSCRNAGVPDVMRGEETQIFGALESGNAAFVLPGTHSKWAFVAGGKVTNFRTHMTGDVFAALKGHTILGRLMTGEQHDGAVFARGVHMGLEQGTQLLHALFSVRTLALFDEIEGKHLASYLSGLLIGAEIASEGPVELVTLIGSERLSEHYALALHIAGRDALIGDPNAAVRGLQRVGKAAGLVP